MFYIYFQNVYAILEKKCFFRVAIFKKIILLRIINGTEKSIQKIQTKKHKKENRKLKKMEREKKIKVKENKEVNSPSSTDKNNFKTLSSSVNKT